MGRRVLRNSSRSALPRWSCSRGGASSTRSSRTCRSSLGDSSGKLPAGSRQSPQTSRGPRIGRARSRLGLLDRLDRPGLAGWGGDRPGESRAGRGHLSGPSFGGDLGLPSRGTPRGRSRPRATAGEVRRRRGGRIGLDAGWAGSRGGGAFDRSRGEALDRWRDGLFRGRRLDLGRKDLDDERRRRVDGRTWDGSPGSRLPPASAPPRSPPRDRPR